MLSRALALTLLASALAAAETPAPSAPPKVVVVKAARVIAPDSGKVLTNQVILIEGDKIKAIGTAAEVGATPAEATVVDLGHATVLPGLIDCHTHLTGQPRNYYEDKFRRSPIDKAVVAHVYARRTLEAGFTSVRDVGSSEYIDIALRNAINEGDIPGPRMAVAGLTLGATGGHIDLASRRICVSRT